MEVFREKSNYEGVLSVYEAMKVRGVTPGAKVRALCCLCVCLSVSLCQSLSLVVYPDVFYIDICLSRHASLSVAVCDSVSVFTYISVHPSLR